MAEKESAGATCVQHKQRLIASKSREIHSRAKEMVREGNERMEKGIKAVIAKNAEGEKRMSAGIKAIKERIITQIKANKVAMQEMQNKISRFEAHIRGYERETAHFIKLFYYGEGKS